MEVSSLRPTNDATMQSFVDGVAPKEARKVVTSNADVEAWRLKDQLYVRTSLTLASPGPINRARHVSGVNVYTVPDVPVLGFTQEGRTSFVTLER